MNGPKRLEGLVVAARRLELRARAASDHRHAPPRPSELELRLGGWETELASLAVALDELKVSLNRPPPPPSNTAVEAVEAARQILALTSRVRVLAQTLRSRELEDQITRRELTRIAEQHDLEVQGRLSAEAKLELTVEQLSADRRRLAEIDKELTTAISEGTAARQSLTEVQQELADAKADLGVARVGVESSSAEVDRRVKQNETLHTQLNAADHKRQQITSDYSARVRALEQTLSTLTVALRDTKSDVERALASHAWRIGHRITKAASFIARRPIRTQGSLVQALVRIERLQDDLGRRALPPAVLDPPATPPPGERPGREPSSVPTDEVRRYRAALAHELRFRLGPIPELDQWPTVSAVVVNRDGRAHLERLLHGLTEHTDYPSLELIVVDNASSDSSVQLLHDAQPGFGVTVLPNDRNLSFSEATGQAAAAAESELLLFLNNDIEPFEAGWLKEMVVALTASDATVVGATLVHAGIDTVADPRPAVQHRSIRFGWLDGMIRGYNDGDGLSLWDADFGGERRALAVTAACMLIRNEHFMRLGGFDHGYLYGAEDVDLGLRVRRAGGGVVATGRAVLAHQESSTRLLQDDERRLNRAHNRRVFLERWGAQVRRAYLLSRLRRSSDWTDGQGPHVAITVTSLAQEHAWGDWITAHEFGEALHALGWRVSYIQRQNDDWYSLPEAVDYVVTLMDSFDLRRVPDGVTTVAWIRNWTERWLERPWFSSADLLLASSQRSVELIQQATGRTPTLFPLAANLARFSPQPRGPEPGLDYIFTGNRWGEQRAIETALSPRRGERCRIYGRGWDKVRGLSKAAAGQLLYEQLPEVYATTKLVIDDAQAPTLPYESVNGRVSESLAVGTLVVTNGEAGVRELFDDEFPVWSSRETLRSALDKLLTDDERRQSLARRYRSMVVHDHTYAHRADTLRRLLIAHENTPSFCLKIGAPSREVAHSWGDLPFAEAFARELQRRGHRTRVETLDEWESEAGLAYDVVIHLKGLSHYHVKPGQFNILWSISHPSELTGEECDGYDLAFVASERFALDLQTRTETPIEVLEQATDPRVFYPDPNPDYTHDLVYVANSRNVQRPIMRDLLPTDHDLAIWGANWEGFIDMKYVVADHIPNEELRQVYSSATIVLCDHWEDMREHGYISNRVFDALACGARVVSDEVAGLKAKLGEAVITYHGRDELHAVLAQVLADAPFLPFDANSPIAAIAEHTFAERADSLLKQLDVVGGTIVRKQRVLP